MKRIIINNCRGALIFYIELIPIQDYACSLFVSDAIIQIAHMDAPDKSSYRVP